jgi:hypothetical protein
MLYYVTREQHGYTIDRLLGSFKNSWLPRPDMARLSYETLFALRRAPIGNYVFTDIDRLSGYEIDAAGQIASSLERASPGVIISNHPNRVLNRYALLRRLYEAGINSFNVWRLDEERMPSAYPVFIRREQDALGAESPLLHNEREYRDAVAHLLASGKGPTGRLAVQYVRAAGADGLHRKYGAFCLRGLIVPQHLMISDSWVVKRGMTAADLSVEEESYMKSNPHADQVREIFQLAEIDFGRMDYGLVDGRMEVFEINTNPSFPRARMTQDRNMIRRRIVIEGVVAGFAAMDAAPHAQGLVRIRTPKPKLHRLRNRPWTRRFKDALTWGRWHAAGLRTASKPVEQRQPQPEPE